MLDNYITTQENVINGKLAKIKELEALIEQLRKEVRLDEQLRQARVTASQELAQWLAKGKELLGDMAGIFPIEFLEDVKSELGTITEEIKEDYQSYCDNGDRFLSASDNSETENNEPITPINPENEINESAIEPDSETLEDTETIEVEAIETEDNETIEAVAVESDTEDNSENNNKVSALNATELAKRLGFKTHHEVTSKFKNLSKDSFIQWTVYHDPDKYGWYKVNGKYQKVA